MIPTPTEITHFIEIYQTQHISRSAVRLGVTQPTLTQSLKKLEAKLKTTLFHRTKSGVLPTQTADQFYHRARTLLEQWSSIQDHLQESSNEISGTFRVGCHSSVGAYALPTLFQHLDQSAPNIEIQLVHDWSRKILEGIISYQIDLAFVINPYRHPDLVLKKLGEDRVMFWKKTGLDNPPKRIFVDLNVPQFQKLIDQAPKKLKEEYSIVNTSSLEMIRTLTLAGAGVGVLPKRVALADQSGISPLSSKLPEHLDEIYLAYRKEALTTQAARLLIQLASQSILSSLNPKPQPKPKVKHHMPNDGRKNSRTRPQLPAK